MRSSFTNYKSYEDILAEAHRLTELPDWVHWAGLCEAAMTLFPKRCPSVAAFHNDAKPSFGVTTSISYLQALQVWKKVPNAVRNKYQHVTHYLAVHRDPRYSGKNGAALVMKAAQANVINLYAYLKGMTSALNVLGKSPKLLRQVTDTNLLIALDDAEGLTQWLTEELSRRKQRHVA